MEICFDKSIIIGISFLEIGSLSSERVYLEGLACDIIPGWLQEDVIKLLA